MPDTLSLEGLTKHYGGLPVVDDISHCFEAGKFTTLLGPSGCGKTTTLRMIAGLERPDAGRIELGQRVLSADGAALFIEPERRGMGMVFQSYAVWPHMTVAENVAFPLQVRGMGRSEREQRVGEVLDMVGLSPFRDSSSTRLSGGQQQRVAIARALVYRPAVLLCDEPLSNLDAKLRESMRLELRQLQRSLGTTTIMVTHDQSEAMAVSDCVVVMRDGRIEQFGAPEAIHADPASEFVMDFLGIAVRLPATVLETGELALDGAQVRVRVPGLAAMAPGTPVVLSLRQDCLGLVPPGTAQPGDWPARITAAAFLGHTVEYAVRIGDRDVRLSCPPSPRFAEGEQVHLRARIAEARVWPAAGRP